MAKNVGLISATAGDFSIETEGLLTLSGDLAGINASNDIKIFGDAADVAVIAAEGSVGDLTAGGDILIRERHYGKWHWKHLRRQKSRT